MDFPPSRAAAFDLFAGTWSSDVPGIGGGGAALFDDERVRWLEDRAGGFAGKTVLELGPLEGGHTWMMAKSGARVTAIESNVRAFMKCLIVKNALGLDADFQLGDFRPYLATTTDRYDFLMMSGVLYHMTDPVAVLRDAARVADSFGIWTHYFDAARVMARKELAHKFAAQAETAEFNGKRIELHRQRYKKARAWDGFCGGDSAHSYWLTRQSLFDLLDALGFDVTPGEETPDHQNGPAILLYARRR